MRHSLTSRFKFAVAGFLALALVACGGEEDLGGMKKTTALPDYTPQDAADKADQIAEDALLADGRSEEDQAAEKIKVAVLLPVTGANEQMGRALLQAVTLALFDSYDPRITLYPLDTKGTKEGASAAAQQAIDLQASIVIGPLLSESVKSAGDLLSEADIPLIGLSNDRTAAKEGQYLIGYLPETEVSRVVSYSLLKGKSRMAALIPKTDYGFRVLDSFADTMDALDGTISGIQTYEQNPDTVQDTVKTIANYAQRYRAFRNEILFLRGLDQDMSDALATQLERAEQIEEPDFDAVLLPEGGDMLRTMVPLLPYYEVDPKKIQFLGTGLFYNEALYNEPSLQGSWFAGVPAQQLADFTAHYEKTFGVEPPKLASLAYDAMGLVAMIIRSAEEDAPEQAKETEDTGEVGEVGEVAEVKAKLFSHARLQSPQGFFGVNGLFRFLPDGTNERALAVLEFTKDGPKVIDAAPTEFPAFGYMIKRVTGRAVKSPPASD